MKTINENLVNSNNHLQNEKLINIVDKLLVERLPELVNEELKWICKNYGNNEVSNLLNGDDYYLLSPILNKLIEIYSRPFNNELDLFKYQLN